MRTHIDKTIPVIIMAYGVFFCLLFLISFNLNQKVISIFWLFLGLIMVFVGFWKLESYEIIDGKLIKSNFFGLYKEIIDLKIPYTYNKKIINTGHIKNPFNIVKWFSNDKKYLIFRKVNVITQSGKKITIDERTIKKDDFNVLYEKIKKYKKHTI